MPQPRVAVRLAALGIVAALLLSAIGPIATLAARPESKLGKHDRALLADARADGRRTVTLLIATAPGGTQSVADAIAAQGGAVRYRDNDLGYIRAAVPTGKAEEAAAIGGMQSADIEVVIPLDNPRPGGATNPTPFPAPSPTTPRANPYMPTGDTGAAAFIDAHPTWDGRGVTVGILDTGITLDHPALSTTTTGAPKIIDWVTHTDPTF